MEKNKIVDRYDNYEDRLLVNQVIEAAEKSIRGYTYKCTNFLDPRQQKLICDVLRHYKNVAYIFIGGYENAERNICIISHEDYDIFFNNDEVILETIAILKFTWYICDKKISHRDFLGSLIGSGIKREMIGDIILEDESAYIICKKEIEKYIMYNVTHVGSIPIEIVKVDGKIKKNENTKTINSTIASLRLDSIISTGFGVSRSKAVELIKSKKAHVNWEEVESPAKEVKQNDIISVRGKGRVILEEIQGNTRKDRIRIILKKFV